MNVANILDSITDDIAGIIAAVRGTPTPVTTPAQTNAALALAQSQQQQNTLMWLGIGALAVFAFTRR